MRIEFVVGFEVVWLPSVPDRILLVLLSCRLWCLLAYLGWHLTDILNECCWDVVVVGEDAVVGVIWFVVVELLLDQRPVLDVRYAVLREQAVFLQVRKASVVWVVVVAELVVAVPVLIYVVSKVTKLALKHLILLAEWIMILNWNLGSSNWLGWIQHYVVNVHYSVNLVLHLVLVRLGSFLQLKLVQALHLVFKIVLAVIHLGFSFFSLALLVWVKWLECPRSNLRLASNYLVLNRHLRLFSIQYCLFWFVVDCCASENYRIGLQLFTAWWFRHSLLILNWKVIKQQTLVVNYNLAAFLIVWWLRWCRNKIVCDLLFLRLLLI